MKKQPVILGVVPSDLSFWCQLFHMIDDTAGATNVLRADKEISKQFQTLLRTLEEREQSFMYDTDEKYVIGSEKLVYFSE